MKAKTIREVFPQRYRYYMNVCGKTRQDIVRDLDFKYTTICDWENGTTIPRMDKVERLAQYFGCKNSDLLQEPQVAEQPTVTNDDELSRVKMQLVEKIKTLSDDEVSRLLQVAELILTPQKQGTD